MPEILTPILKEVELRRVIGAVEKGRSFEDRRDAAILRIFLATGMRLAELTDLRFTPTEPETNDVDLDDGQIRIFRGEGGRQRLVAIGPRPASPSIATSVSGQGGPTTRASGCGSAARAASAGPASPRW